VDNECPVSLIPYGSSQWKPKGQSSRSVVRSNHTHLCDDNFKGHVYIYIISVLRVFCSLAGAMQ